MAITQLKLRGESPHTIFFPYTFSYSALHDDPRYYSVGPRPQRTYKNTDEINADYVQKALSAPIPKAGRTRAFG